MNETLLENNTVSLGINYLWAKINLSNFFLISILACLTSCNFGSLSHILVSCVNKLISGTFFHLSLITEITIKFVLVEITSVMKNMFVVTGLRVA